MRERLRTGRSLAAIGARKYVCLTAALAVGCLAWAAQAVADIGRANLDGSGVTPSSIATPGTTGVAVDGGHLYWADSRLPGLHGLPSGHSARALENQKTKRESCVNRGGIVAWGTGEPAPGAAQGV